MSTPRRRFLGWLGSASLLGVAARPSIGTLARQEFALDDVDGHAAPLAATYDMSWTERVTGKYKAVFDSPEIASGAALARAVAWCDMYKEVYGAERTEMSAVIVLRHWGFMLAMNDEFWQRFDVGKETKSYDEKGKKWAKRNPLGGSGAATDTDVKNSIPAFIAAGGIVLACGWTLGGAAARIAKAEKIDRVEARAKAVTMMIPGTIVQPNGIFAALRAQEAGCNYVLAS